MSKLTSEVEAGLERLANEAARDLEDASADEILRWAAATFGDRFCVLSSMGDAVMASLAAKAKPGRRRRVPRHRLSLRRDPRRA